MSTEHANHRHWSDADRGRYEVWYLTWNDPATEHGFWLRYIIEQPLQGEPRGELWFARFDPKDPARTFAIHKHVPYSTVAAAEGPFALSIGGARLGHDHAVGQLAGDGHDIRWDLRWEPAREVLRFVPDVMYARGGLGETTPHSPNPRVPLSGALVVDGHTYRLDRAPMGQTHLWGKKHAFAWVWGHCNDWLDAPDAVMEILGVRLQRKGVTTPKLFMLNLRLDGERYELNQYRHVVRNRVTWDTGRVQFTAQSLTAKVEGEMSCTPAQMVNAPYEDPDGQDLWCVNTEIGDARITVFKRAGLGWREHRTLTATRRAHFEMGSRTRDPAVTREHILVR